MHSPELNSLLNRKLVMEKRFPYKVEDNAPYEYGLKRHNKRRDNLLELKEIWDHWDDETKQLFYSDYGDLHYLLDVKVDKHFFQAFTQYWNPAYSCFTFGK
ncbi:hypothetical protein Golob_007793, partial [Gossypium lobatum]|nr:hypothetical protein [Gossypium lobatum]